jgi:hypothetical protein
MRTVRCAGDGGHQVREVGALYKPWSKTSSHHWPRCPAATPLCLGQTFSHPEMFNTFVDNPNDTSNLSGGKNKIYALGALHALPFGRHSSKKEGGRYSRRLDRELCCWRAMVYESDGVQERWCTKAMVLESDGHVRAMVLESDGVPAIAAR